VFASSWIVSACVIAAVWQAWPARYAGSAEVAFRGDLAVTYLKLSSAQAQREIAGDAAVAAAMKTLSKESTIPVPTATVQLAEDADGAGRLHVCVTGTDADVAQRLSGELASRWTENFNSRMEKALQDEISACQTRAKELGAQLQPLEEELARLQKVNPAAGESNPAWLSSRLNQIQASIASQAAVRDSATRRLAQLNEQAKSSLNSTSPRSVRDVYGPNPERQRIQGQIEAYNQEIWKARNIQHKTEKHPDVVALRAQVAALELRLKEVPADVVVSTEYSAAGEAGPTLQQALVERSALQRDMQAATEEIARLQVQQQEYQKAMEQHKAASAETGVLASHVEAGRKGLSAVQARLSEAQQRLASREEQPFAATMTSLDGAKVESTKPGLPIRLAIAVVLGLATGLAAAVMSARTQDVVFTAEQAQDEFDLPVLGAIGKICDVRTGDPVEAA
jgi:hypothetical protein